MAKDNASPGSRVIVVGDPGDELMQTTVRLAREREIDAVPCENVYAAVVALAQAAGRHVLVVGQIKELAGENGAFFGIVTAHAACCCCLLDKSSPAGQENLLMALRVGVTILGRAPDVRGVLAEWLAAPGPREARRRARDASHAQRHAWEETCEDLRATEEELSALLG